MRICEKIGDTCKACIHNKPTVRVCPTCGQILNQMPALDYCHKNKFWIHEEQGGPCQFFERGKYIDLT